MGLFRIKRCCVSYPRKPVVLTYFLVCLLQVQLALANILGNRLNLARPLTCNNPANSLSYRSRPSLEAKRDNVPFLPSSQIVRFIYDAWLIEQLANLNISVFHGSNVPPQNHSMYVSGEVLDVPVATL